MMLNPGHIPLAASILFCCGAVLSAQVNADLVEQHWPTAALFLVTGLFAALVVLYLFTILPLQSDLATEVRRRIDADENRDAAQRRAAKAVLACEIDRDQLARESAELKRKTECVDQIGAEVHRQRLELDQILREKAPKPKPKRGGGGERGGPPKF